MCRQLSTRELNPQLMWRSLSECFVTGNSRPRLCWFGGFVYIKYVKRNWFLHTTFTADLSSSRQLWGSTLSRRIARKCLSWWIINRGWLFSDTWEVWWLRCAYLFLGIAGTYVNQLIDSDGRNSVMVLTTRKWCCIFFCRLIYAASLDFIYVYFHNYNELALRLLWFIMILWSFDR